MTASSLYDQGSVHAAQYPNKFKEGPTVEVTGDSTILSDNPTLPTPPGDDDLFPFVGPEVYNVVRTAVTSVPFDETVMYKQDPNIYAGPAKDGVCMPMKIKGDSEFIANDDYATNINVIPYIGAVGQLVSQRETAMFGVDAFARSFTSGEAEIQTAFPSFPVYPQNRAVVTAGQTGDPNHVVPMCSLNPVGCRIDPLTSFSTGMDPAVNQGVVIFRGLDLRATITVKSFLGIELVPMNTSPALPFTHTPLKYEPRAMHIMTNAMREKRGAFPASENNFGDVFKEIASVVNEVVQAAAPVVSVIAPELAPFAAGAAGLSKTANAIIQKVGGQSVNAPKSQRAVKPSGKLALRRTRN
jgi:hypothetical protein